MAHDDHPLCLIVCGGIPNAAAVVAAPILKRYGVDSVSSYTAFCTHSFRKTGHTSASEELRTRMSPMKHGKGTTQSHKGTRAQMSDGDTDVMRMRSRVFEGGKVNTKISTRKTEI